MTDEQGALNRMISQYNGAMAKPLPVDEQMEARLRAYDRELRGNRITLTIAWAFWGVLVLAYIGFYYVYVPMHEAGLHP